MDKSTPTAIAATVGVDKAPPPKEKLSKEEEARANLQKNKAYDKGCKLADPSMARFLDVAVLRCLFASQWLEEGILWSLLFLEKRLVEIRFFYLFNFQRFISPGLEEAH